MLISEIMKKVLFATLLGLSFFASLLAPAHAESQATIIPNHTGYLDLTSIPTTYHVVGEVNNSGTTNLKSLNVTATFCDSIGNVIGSAFAYTMLDVLLPNMKAPFEIVLIDGADQVNSYALTLRFDEFQGSKPPFLTLVNVSKSLDVSGFTHVLGEMRNLASQSATSAKVAATFFDINHNVVSAAFEYCIPSTIEPMDKAVFEIIPSRRIGGDISFVLVAESAEYSIVPEFSSAQAVVFAGILSLVLCFAWLKLHLK